MHGLINRSIQCFVRDTYGQEAWVQIALDARIGHENFEAMLVYDDDQTFAVLEAACHVLDKPAETLLEDVGTYLVSHPSFSALRRLLRFGGESFVDFLYSLDDLRDRARLAVPDIDLPLIELHEVTSASFTVSCGQEIQGFSYVIMGILRAMADDYGALVFLEHLGSREAADHLGVSLLEAAFAQGRSFDLAGEVSL
ncbi:MAG: heme NO-binding domain-containing protein [Paracoccaceae bacterium]